MGGKAPSSLLRCGFIIDGGNHSGTVQLAALLLSNTKGYSDGLRSPSPVLKAIMIFTSKDVSDASSPSVLPSFLISL